MPPESPGVTHVGYVYPDKYGVHRCAAFGDFRARIKDIGTFLGYTVIEEDV